MGVAAEHQVSAVAGSLVDDLGLVGQQQDLAMLGPALQGTRHIRLVTRRHASAVVVVYSGHIQGSLAPAHGDPLVAQHANSL